MQAQKKPGLSRRVPVVQRGSIERCIYFVRSQRVMIDNDLADLYRVTTGTLNQAVRRNMPRFPADFMFQLTSDEAENLRSQIVISSWGGRRYLPFVFTGQGVAMLSSVLKSDRAIQVNIAIMRAFVKLRELLATHKELGLRLEELEKKFLKHDGQIQEVFHAIRALLAATPAKGAFGYPAQRSQQK
jgi:ORF6N domain